MKFVKTLVLLSALAMAQTVYAETVTPTLDVEQKIAYDQGRFGALYARCAPRGEQTFISGGLASWRAETFLGYNGTPPERAHVEQAFDAAVNAVNADASACEDWRKQAAVAWNQVVQLAQSGMVVSTN